MMMIFSLLLGSLVIWRGILIQNISRKWKIVLSVIALLAAFKFYIQRLFGGALFAAPEFPAWILLIMTWFFAVMMFFSLWLIIFEAGRGIAWLIVRLRKKKLYRFFTDHRWRAAGMIPAALLVTLGMYEGLKNPEVRRHEIVCPGLPAGWDGLRIVHLTDIHADPFTGREKVQFIVETSNSLNPDLIVITGDFVDGRMEVRGKDLEVLNQLRAPLGVYGVPGNHEYYSGYSQWMKYLAANQVVMLENRNVMLGDDFSLGGVTDPAAQKRGGVLPDIAGTFDGVPEGSFKLLLAHQPKLAELAAKEQVDLQLSGHTHGGMMWGMDFLVGLFNHGLVSGSYDVDGMKLFIANGTGIWNGFPIRLGHPAEIALLTLRSAPSQL